jgi:hypothetical protein
MTTPTIAAPPITTQQVLGFTLSGLVPPGGTFVEPTVVEVDSTGETAGTIMQSPSVIGSANSDGSIPFTTACTYTNPSPGTATLEIEVLGVDDYNITVTIEEPAAPESITGVSNFTVTPIAVTSATATPTLSGMAKTTPHTT